MKTSSSERGTINVVTAGKDITVRATTQSNIRDRPPSRHLPAKRASPSQYIANMRQHMRTDTYDIEAVVLSLSCPEERAKYAAMAPDVS